MSAKQLAVASVALQYSKWLSRFICWVWAIYRFFVIFAGILRPEAADAFVTSIPGMDTIMLANVSTYLINSIGEKYIYSDRFVMKWLDKKGFTSLIPTFMKKNNTKDEEIVDTEEVDNG